MAAEAIQCQSCGKATRKGARFCDQCGFPLGRREADLTFGRDKDCSIRFASEKVSRRHARAILVNGQWFLKDEGSTNGTFINGQRLSEARRPSHWRPVPIGAKVRFADTEVRLTQQGWMDADGKILWQLPAVSCPSCHINLPQSMLLAFCPACGHSLRWLEAPPSPVELSVRLGRNEPVQLKLRFAGVGQEPLSVQVQSQRPDRLLLDVGGVPSVEGRWSGRAGETISLSLLPQLSRDETQPCECPLLLRSIFAADKTEALRSVWRPDELETECTFTVRLVPIFVRVEWGQPVLFFSERHRIQSVRLVNPSPIAVQGTTIMPEEIAVQPERWRLDAGAEMEFTVAAQRAWSEEHPLSLLAQPDDGEPVQCDVYWVGGEQETVREPDVIVGVDFGTSKSAIAYRDKRQADVTVRLLQLQGRDWLPSTMVFLPGRREPLLGRDAEARLGDPEAMPIQGVKLLLRSEQTIGWQGQRWTPVELMQRFLRFLHEQVEAKLGSDMDCLKRYELGLPVLDDPQKYEAQRSLSLRAAEEAGMRWVRAWWEPICAAAFVLYRWSEFASNLPPPVPGDLVLVLDWGAGTLDAAVLRYEHHQPPFFALPPLLGFGLEQGGNFLDWQLTCDFLRRAGLSHLLKEAERLGWKEFRWKGSLALRQLSEAVRQAKEGLGQTSRPAQYTVGDFRAFLTDPTFADLAPSLPLVTSSTLQSIVREVLDELKTLMDARLTEANWHDIDYAIIVGGSGQIPVVRDIVGEWIGKPNRVLQLQGNEAILAVAFGAAVLSEVQIRNAVPFSLALQINGEMEELLRTGDVVTRPINRRYRVPFTGLTATLLISIGRQRYKFATVTIAPKQVASVRMQLSVDDDGWLNWRWTDEPTRKVLHEQQLLALP